MRAVAHEPPLVHATIDRALARLDMWFESIRGTQGYGGPVAHWWQQSLMYTGAGLDWRYEGIIAGYLSLWQRTGDERWLTKARRAGDDLVAGQDAEGHYAASAFELNPATAGTPHEAACDIGLLLLAQALRDAGQIGWETYAACATHNLRAFYIGKLWDAEAGSFRDDPCVPTFVPNKAATACEAFMLLANLTGDELLIERYVLPTLDRLVEHQVRGEAMLDGAIAQNSFGMRRVEKYFPIYIARCIPALLRGFHVSRRARYVDCALRAMAFILRWQRADGSLPTVVYPNKRVSWFPSWVAPLGDVLRAADELQAFGLNVDLSATRQHLLAGQDTSGGIRTASGFAGQASGQRPTLPDMRDLLHVAGWCDKAFRYLAAHAGPHIPIESHGTFEAECVFRGQRMQLTETPTMVEITRRLGVCYRWHKGMPWPEVATPEFWLH